MISSQPPNSTNFKHFSPNDRQIMAIPMWKTTRVKFRWPSKRIRPKLQFLGASTNTDPQRNCVTLQKTTPFSVNNSQMWGKTWIKARLRVIWASWEYLKKLKVHCLEFRCQPRDLTCQKGAFRGQASKIRRLVSAFRKSSIFWAVNTLLVQKHGEG